MNEHDHTDEKHKRCRRLRAVSVQNLAKLANNTRDACQRLFGTASVRHCLF